MAEAELITSYVKALSAQLRGVWPQRARLLEEVRAHLEDAAESLGAAAAIARFGPASVVARRFADQRLVASVQLAFPAVLAGLVVLAACSWLEAAFPVAAVFHLDAPAPVPTALVVACQVLQACTWPLLGLAAWVLRRGSASVASSALIAAVVSAIAGFSGTAFVRLLSSMSQFGAASTAPLLIRVGVIVVLMVLLAPTLVAHDAASATRGA